MGGFGNQNLLTVVEGRRGGWVYKSENVDLLLTVGGEGGLKAKMLLGFTVNSLGGGRVE